jgi:hypothetical protein
LKYLSNIVALGLLISYALGLHRAWAVFHWTSINRQIHNFISAPLLYIFLSFATLHIIEYIFIPINQVSKERSIWLVKSVIIIAGIIISIYLTRGNWVGTIR